MPYNKYLMTCVIDLSYTKTRQSRHINNRTFFKTIIVCTVSTCRGWGRVLIFKVICKLKDGAVQDEVLHVFSESNTWGTNHFASVTENTGKSVHTRLHCTTMTTYTLFYIIYNNL